MLENEHRHLGKLWPEEEHQKQDSEQAIHSHTSYSIGRIEPMLKPRVPPPRA